MSKLGEIVDFLKKVFYLNICCDVIHWREYLKKGTHFPHPRGIVINFLTKMGRRVTIYQNVTIGSHKGGVPIIEDDVMIYANSCIIGGITLGEGCVIGAGSVVVKSVPRGEIWAGNPAKRIKY